MTLLERLSRQIGDLVVRVHDLEVQLEAAVAERDRLFERTRDRFEEGEGPDEAKPSPS